MKNNISVRASDAINEDDESLRVRNRFLMLHRIGNDLSTCASFDDLCRQAVVHGKQLLQCQRIGIWFRKRDSMVVTGSFGVDEEGNVRDERAQALTLAPRSSMGQALSNKHPLSVSEDCLLRNDKGMVVGRGTHVVAALWNGSHVIGCICVDNLLDQNKFSAGDLDILVMYASIIGHLAFGKRAEDDLKKSLREKEILLREIHHRVKNNLQIISSLLNLQSAYIRDSHDAELFRQTQSRVKSMAKAYDLLCQSDDCARINIHDCLTGIIHDLFQSYQVNPSSVGLRWEGDRHDVFPMSQAIPCSLLVNELATNALKHGFKQGHPEGARLKGEITVRVQRNDQRLSVTIENNGAEFPPDVDVHHPLSLGLQLVNVLAAQLNGTFSLEKRRGARFTITFPDMPDNASPGINAAISGRRINM